MEASTGLVAGLDNRNELAVIRPEGKSSPKTLQQLSGQICQICGDDVGLTADGELFVACNECAFPVCRTCYEYERRERNQVCPQCKTRFKRLKGSSRVPGDEEEDDVDDIENEFSFAGRDRQDMQYLTESMFQGHMRYGRGNNVDMPHVVHTMPQVPLLTNGQMLMTFLQNSMPWCLHSWAVEERGSTHSPSQILTFQISGPVKGSRCLWLWKCGMEGEDGELETKTRECK